VDFTLQIPLSTSELPLKKRNPSPQCLGNHVKRQPNSLTEARTLETDSGGVISSLVFHRGGEPVNEFRKSWATACKKAECEKLIFHDFRRSAARNLVR